MRYEACGGGRCGMASPLRQTRWSLGGHSVVTVVAGVRGNGTLRRRYWPPITSSRRSPAALRPHASRFPTSHPRATHHSCDNHQTPKHQIPLAFTRWHQRRVARMARNTKKKHPWTSFITIRSASPPFPFLPILDEPFFSPASLSCIFLYSPSWFQPSA